MTPTKGDEAGSWPSWWRARRLPDALDIARSQGFVVTAAQLAARGISRDKARWEVRQGRWWSPAYGVVAPVDVRDDDRHLVRRRRAALTAAAAALRRSGHVVSGRSAAVLHALPTFRLPERGELTDPATVAPGRRSGVHVRTAALTRPDVRRWFGVTVTSVARTLVDLARHDRRDAIMAADAALRHRSTSSTEIAGALERAAGWPGVRQARSVLAQADARAESPLESLARLTLVDDGFPLPELQVEIAGYRVDMLVRAARLVIEVDGLAKYSADALRREKRREQRLRAAGYRVERLTWDDVVRRWPITRTWLRAAVRLPA
jgi:very-short-patch-repair endonuclease